MNAKSSNGELAKTILTEYMYDFVDRNKNLYVFFAHLHMDEETPRCCRHTCISLLAEANVLPTYSMMIVGHKGAMTMTEKVYTHIDMRYLINAVNSINYPKSIKHE